MRFKEKPAAASSEYPCPTRTAQKNVPVRFSNDACPESVVECENATVACDMPSEGLTGQIELVRTDNGTKNLCEALATPNRQNELWVCSDQ